jgi:WD40 repeat protein/energy-coupling factor transporter ATP-binding protein EcfA2
MRPEGLTALADVGRPSNPFPGLRPFEFGESHLYFGRDGQTDELIRKLAAKRFVAVVGTSGSGKSSLVRAGLLPDLFGGFMPSAGTRWRVALMRPTNDPLGNLARALCSTEVFGSEIEENARIQEAVTEATLRRGGLGLVEAVRQNRMASNESLLVVVDQFEELFRFARVSASEQYRYEAAAFVKLLLEAARQREQNVYVVLTMRSDFLGDCSIFWGLPEAINEGQYLVPRMTRDQRAEAVTGPVAVGGGEMAQRLVNRLLNDTGDSPDMLPILQHALMRTWENWAADHAEGEPVDLRHYEAVGTMADALSRHADEAFNELADEDEQGVTERVFKALTEKGEDNREVRRPTVLAELCAQVGATTDEVVSVIEVFRREGRSFLMPPPPAPLDEESLIDISHESLIRNWQRLREWVDEESQSAHIYKRLAETAVLHEQGQAGLWRDPDLQVALDWREHTRLTLAWGARYHPAFKSAMKFLEASVEARDAAAREEEQRRVREAKRTRAATLVFFTLFMLSLAAFAVAYYKSIQAKDALRSAEAESANSRRLLYASDMNLAQQSYDAGNLARATELINAHAPGGPDSPGFEWYYLRRLLHAETESLNVELRGGHKLQSAVLTGDGKTLFIDKGDAVELWDVASRRMLRSIDKDSEMTATDISPDGRLVALGGPSVSTAVTLIDATTGKELFKLGGEGDAALTVPDKEFEGGVSVVKFSPDGSALAVGAESGSVKPPEVTLWDVGSHKRTAVFQGKYSITSIVFSPDGKTVAVGEGDRYLELRNVVSGQSVCSSSALGGNVGSVFYLNDEIYLAVSDDRSVNIWPPGNCDERHTEAWFSIGSSSSVSAFGLSPDKQLLAVSSEGSVVKIYGGDLYRTEVASFKGHGRYINSVAFLADNRTLVTASEDGAVKLWDAPALILEHETLGGHTSPIVGLAYSPDGKRLASVGGADGTARLWDAWTRQLLNVFLPSQTGQIYAAAFSPDGRTLVAGSEAGENPSLRVWDAGSFDEQTPFDIKHDSIFAVAFSPDGGRVVSGGGKLRVWDASSRALLKEIDGATYRVAFSRDGRMFAAARREGGVRLWDGALTKELRTFDAKGVGLLAFSPDGRVLAASFEQGTVKLWDTDTGAELATLSGHNGAVFTVAFSPDGRTIATGGEDALVKLWSTTSFKELVTLAGHTDAVTALAFSPDGRTLASAGFDKTVRLWRAASDEEVKARASSSR